MSSVQHLREFISARLTATAEEIFSEFEKTIEEEIDRQRRLLEISWKPQITLHRTDFLQQHGCKQEKLLSEEQDFSLNQEEPEAQPTEEEQMKPCSSGEREPRLPDQVTDAFMTPSYHNSVCCKAEPNTFQPAESPNEEGSHDVDTGLTRLLMVTGHHNGLDASSEPDSGFGAHTCRTCGKRFANGLSLQLHQKIHTSGHLFSCDSCGKTFSFRSTLTAHMRLHKGEKMHACQMCFKRFASKGTLLTHMKVHTGELLSCKTCGKSFATHAHLSTHMRVHTGEKPFSCAVCGKRFTQSGNFSRHVRSHTGEKPFSCGTCGKSFSHYSGMLEHASVHTGEKPFGCATCGKRFRRKCDLTTHTRVHKHEHVQSS